MFDYTAVRLPFYTSSPQNLHLSHRCSSVLYTHWDTWSPMLFLPFSWFYSLSSSFVFPSCFFILYLMTSCLHFLLCSIHIINPSFYIFYPFIYLLHWPFDPLPMPVSVWVLCQPLCQDRSPATPASGGTERETGRAHCHCWTGVVLQLGYTL